MCTLIGKLVTDNRNNITRNVGGSEKLIWIFLLQFRPVTQRQIKFDPVLN